MPINKVVIGSRVDEMKSKIALQKILNKSGYKKENKTFPEII